MDELDRLADEVREADAVSARRRARGLADAAAEGATWRGTLLDLFENTSTVTVATSTGRVFRGVLETIGADFVVVAGPTGDRAWLGLASVVTVSVPDEASARIVADDRQLPDTRFVEAMARMAEDRPEVVLLIAGGEQVVGTLSSVGADVLTVLLGREPRTPVYVSAEAVLGVLRSG